MNLTNELINFHLAETIRIIVEQRSTPLSFSTNNCFDTEDIGTKVENKKIEFLINRYLISFHALQTLIVRAFHLKCDFFLYYLAKRKPKSPIKWISIESDQDLLNALAGVESFTTTGNNIEPIVNISLDLVDYKKLVMMSAANVLSEWDVITSSDIVIAKTLAKTNSFIFSQIEKFKNKARCLNEASTNTMATTWSLAETVFQYILSSYEESDAETIPINDVALRSFLDQEGRIVSQRNFRLAVYRRGVDPSCRKVIWKHLLNVYPDDYTGQERIDFIRIRCETYKQMRELWQRNAETDPEVRQLCHMVQKDARRTDRHHPFFQNLENKSKSSGTSADEDDGDNNANITSLHNILVTYALNHKYRYCQGMSDLASPLLYVMKDEAQAYISFCALMKRLGENFATDGQAISRKFAHLGQLIQHYDPELYVHLRANSATDLLFCYRWILLDLKREFPFDDALQMLEIIWASIPPNFSTETYMNLFDSDFLYVPNRDNTMKSLLDDKKQDLKNCEKKIKPENKTLKNLKFMPNMLSSESQNDALDSPGWNNEKNVFSNFQDESKTTDKTSTTTEAHNTHLPQLWDSPKSVRKTFKNSKTNPFEEFEDFPPETNLSDFFYLQSLSRFIEVYDGEDEDSLHQQSVAKDSKTLERPSDELSSTCSTYDSGIQRSNTLNSVNQEEFQALRQRFSVNVQPMAHCNGDFDEDVLEDYSKQIANDSIEIDPGYLTDHNHQKTDHSSSSQQFENTSFSQSASWSKMSPNSLSPKKSFLSRPLIKAKQLLGLGRSASVDSLSSNTTATQVLTASVVAGVDITATSFQNSSSQDLSCDLRNQQTMVAISPESIVEEFNYLSATKSVSEEMLNSTMIHMETLSVNNDEHVSSSSNRSSNSSFEILPATNEILEKLQEDQEKELKELMDLQGQLPSPKELNVSDAFMLFLCLTLLLQNRQKIIDEQMDRNDIQMFFDGLIRKHNVRSVLHDTRHLFHSYLSNWHQPKQSKQCSTNLDD